MSDFGTPRLPPSSFTFRRIMSKSQLVSLREHLPILVLRGLFLTFAGAMGVYAIKTLPGLAGGWGSFFISGGIFFLAVVIVLFDMAIKNKKLDVISAVYFGLIIGFLLTYIVVTAISPFLDLMGGSKDDFKAADRRPEPGTMPIGKLKQQLPGTSYHSHPS